MTVRDGGDGGGGHVRAMPGVDLDAAQTWPKCLDCGSLVESLEYVEGVVLHRRGRDGTPDAVVTLAVMRPCGDTWVICRLP